MHSPRNVLLLNHSGDISGAEKSLLAFLDVCDRKRFRYEVVCPLPSPLGDALSQRGIPSRPMTFARPRRKLTPGIFLQLAGLVRASGRLRQVTRAFEADLVDANTTIAALHAAVGLRKVRVPMVWHVRDLTPLGLAERMIAKRTDAIAAVSHAVENALVEGSLAQNKVRVIHNGIDTERFRPTLTPAEIRAKLSLPPETPLVAVVAQLTPWKGHDVLLRAWAQLKTQGNPAVLLVMGSALHPEDRSWENELKRLANELDLAGSVRFLGRHEDVASIVGAVQAVAVPSRAEPFGRVALEAMALGKPVIGTRAGGLPEVVDDGVTGLLVEPDDAPALADAIGRVLGDPQLAHRLGQAGADRVKAMFDIRRTAQQTEDLYDALLRKGG